MSILRSRGVVRISEVRDVCYRSIDLSILWRLSASVVLTVCVSVRSSQKLEVLGVQSTVGGASRKVQSAISRDI